MVLCGTKNGSSMAPLEETFEAPCSKCSIYGYAILSLVLSVMLFFGSVIISFSLPMVLSTVIKFLFLFHLVLSLILSIVLGLGDISHAIVMRISSVKPVPYWW